MATQATKKAIEATRENDGIVEIRDEDTGRRVYVTWDGDIPFEADKMVRDGWLIQPSCASRGVFEVFKRIN